MRGARRFFVRRRQSEQFAKLIVIDSDGTERALINQQGARSAERLITLDAWYATDQGDHLAYKLSVGGARRRRSAHWMSPPATR